MKIKLFGNGEVFELILPPEYAEMIENGIPLYEVVKIMNKDIREEEKRVKNRDSK